MKKNTLTTLLSVFCIIYGEGYFAQENVIPENGNVGIGTLNPTSKLEVHGRVKIDSSLFVSDSITIMGKSKFSGQVELNSLNFETNLENTSFLFLNQGNSVRKIEFPDFAKAFTKSVYQNDCFSSGEDENDNTLYTAPTWRSVSVPNSQTGFLYTGVGCPANVGIGTATPRVALDAYGTIFSQKIAINKDPLNIGTQLFHLKSPYSNTSNSNIFLLENNSNNALFKVNNLGEVYCKKFAMNVEPNNMGTNFFHMKITSPLPDYGGATVMIIENNERRLLQLNNDGALRTREIFVDSYSPWPDYVFESDYVLPTLSEIKKYITINKHLPKIPSAHEITENGINLGEMNKILLEKVEELTLYLIEQQERIERLEKQVEQLK